MCRVPCSPSCDHSSGNLHYAPASHIGLRASLKLSDCADAAEEPIGHQILNKGLAFPGEWSGTAEVLVGPCPNGIPPRRLDRHCGASVVAAMAALTVRRRIP
jgi:hypothetical protein